MDRNQQAKTGIALGILILGMLAAMVFRRPPAPKATPTQDEPAATAAPSRPAVIEAPIVASHLEGTIQPLDSLEATPGAATGLAPIGDGGWRNPVPPPAADWPPALTPDFANVPTEQPGSVPSPHVAAPPPDRATLVPVDGGVGLVSTDQSVRPPLPFAPDEAAVVEHLIVDGDTLSNLAARYLGSAARFLELFEANRDVLKTPDVLPLGRRLKIPAAHGAADAPPPQAAPPTDPLTPGGLVPLESARPRAERRASYAVETYRVQRGETLAELARRFYGDPRRASELYAANRDRLATPHDLREGMLLVIP